MTKREKNGLYWFFASIIIFMIASGTPNQVIKYGCYIAYLITWAIASYLFLNNDQENDDKN